MKKIFTFFAILFVAYMHSKGAELVGVGQYYPTLKSAFDDINNGTLTGNIELQITSDITEIGIAELFESGYGGFSSYSSVKIYPVGAGNYTINGSIKLKNADNVTIDGRVNQIGNTPSLTINSTNSYAINLVDAEHIKVKYCTLIGSYTVLSLTAGQWTGSNYCKFNNITFKYQNKNQSNNALFESSPFLLNGLNHHHDTIQDCNFDGFLSYNDPINVFKYPHAILLKDGNYAWYIEGNSFYDSGFSVSTQNTSARAIAVRRGTNPAFPSSKIINNYIGGTAPFCGGTSLDITSTGNGEIKFVGIYIEGGTSDSAIVSNNTIKNIRFFDNKHSVPLENSLNRISFTGIHTAFGSASITNNIIGSLNDANSITQTSISGQDTIIGIYNGSVENVYIHNNQIGSINATTNNGSENTNIIGIYKKSGAGKQYISNNTIGGVYGLSYNSNNTGHSETIGILAIDGDSTFVINNSISNLTNNSIGNSGGVYGIMLVGTTKNTITNNTISNLSTLSRNVSKPCAAGIFTYYARMYKNKIFNIQSTTTENVNVEATGIVTTNLGIPPLSEAYQNFIYDITTQATGAQAIASGITGQIFEYFVNNIIALGNSSRRVYAINAMTRNCIFNTVHISGKSNFESSCARFTLNYIPSMKNNILINEKSNISGNSLKHFAMINNHVQFNDVNSNYNIYYIPNIDSGGAYGRFNGIEYDNFATFKSIKTTDSNSVNFDPMLVNAGSPNPLDYYPSNPLIGDNSVSFNTDYFDNIRNINFWAGAIQSSSPLPLNWEQFTAQDKDLYVELNWITLNEKNCSHFNVQSSMDGINWDNLKYVTAQNNEFNIYTEKDFTSFTGSKFYRIQQVDLDGKINYSSVQKINRKQTETFILYPNPTIDNMYIHTQTNAIVEIYSTEGKHLFTQNISPSKNQLNLTQLIKGNYIIRIKDDYKTFTTRFTKQ